MERNQALGLFLLGADPFVQEMMGGSTIKINELRIFKWWYTMLREEGVGQHIKQMHRAKWATEQGRVTLRVSRNRGGNRKKWNKG